VRKRPEILQLLVKHLESVAISELICKIIELESHQPGFIKVLPGQFFKHLKLNASSGSMKWDFSES
jgi:hypothetical protein